MSIVQVFKCPECGKKMSRRLPSRKAWHKSYCETAGKTVRLRAVRPVPYVPFRPRP